MRLFVKILSLLCLFNILLFPVAALAQATSTPKTQTVQSRCDSFKGQFELSTGVNIIGTTTVYCSASELILAVISYVQVIAGTVTAFFLMLGGFLYITSAGNEEQSEKGRKILTNALIGLVIIIMSYAIVRVAAGLITLGK